MKIKFNLGWILSIAAALLLAGMGFMSFYYRENGAMLWPLIVAAALLILPIVAVAYMVGAKECSRPFFFRKNAIIETCLLGTMVLMVIGSMLLVNHLFTVNSRTDAIAGIVADQRVQLNEMKKSYDKHVEKRCTSRRQKLEEVIREKVDKPEEYNRFFPDGGDNVGSKVIALKEKISIEGSTDTVPEVFGREKLHWWQLPSVMKNVPVVSTELDRQYALRVNQDHKDTVNMEESQYWNFEYHKAEDIMSKFTKTDGMISSLWTILAVLLAFLFITIPYTTAQRDSRSKGLFAELSKSDDDDDDSDCESNIGKL